MKALTISTYKPRQGAKMDPKSRTQLAGYVPSEKRVTDLLNAGLIRQAAADTWYDSQFDFSDLENLPDIPPIPRHAPQDLAEVSMLAKHYQERSRIINERLRIASEKGKLKKRAAEPPPPLKPAPQVNPDERLAEDDKPA